MPDFAFETELGCRVAGVDEVGRGPLAGPVTAAAVVLDPKCIPDGLNDSKNADCEEAFGIVPAAIGLRGCLDCARFRR